MRAVVTLLMFLFFSLCFQIKAIEIDLTLSGFSETQETLIEEAVDIVADYFLDPRIEACTNRETVICSVVNEYKYNKLSPSLEVCQVLGLQFQRMRDGFASGSYRVLNLEIIGARLDSDTLGTVYNVRTQVYPLTDELRGTFRLKLNRQLGRTARDWAWVIAHEMLHDLGHNHNSMLQDEVKYNGFQINAYDRCFARFAGIVPPKGIQLDDSFGEPAQSQLQKDIKEIKQMQKESLELIERIRSQLRNKGYIK